MFQGGTPRYDFTAGTRRSVGYLSLRAPGVLAVKIDIFEPGTAHRWQHRWVMRKSTLSDGMTLAFDRYLGARAPKAFAIAPQGYSYHFGGRSLEEVREKALPHCEQRWEQGCRVRLLNDDAAE